MSWRKLAPHLYSAAKLTATGATITLGSTFVSCYLALQIEAASHRTLFKFFPHWYANVEYAYGLDPELLATVRTEAWNKRHDTMTALHIEQQKQGQPSLMYFDDNEKVMRQEQDDLTLSSNNNNSKDDRTKTIFRVESLMEPAKKRVQDISFDVSACAMTA